MDEDVIHVNPHPTDITGLPVTIMTDEGRALCGVNVYASPYAYWLPRMYFYDTIYKQIRCETCILLLFAEKAEKHV